MLTNFVSKPLLDFLVTTDKSLENIYAVVGSNVGLGKVAVDEKLILSFSTREVKL